MHELLWRREITIADADSTRQRIEACPVAPQSHPQLGAEAWSVAEELGWAKTYDAEYVALARLLSCRLVTIDARLRRATDRLGFVVAPHEL